MSGSLPTGVPGGGLPPGLGAPPAPGGAPPIQMPPGHLGPVTIPQSNPGNVRAALEKMHAAAKLINEALPQIPLGTPLYEGALKVATDLNKHLGDAKENAQGTIQTMMEAIQQMRQGPQIPALNQAVNPTQPPAVPIAPAPVA